jgi:hypothetical protein
MIGMMYLVLTAMLALNVSKEAVEAFKKVDKGLTKTIENSKTFGPKGHVSQCSEGWLHSCWNAALRVADRHQILPR